MKKKPYWEMTSKELDEATRQFNEPMVVDRSRPLTGKERGRWRKVRKKRGRPRVGLGHARISVSLERGLLKRVTALAKRRKISRSRLLAEVLSDVLSGAE